VDAAVQPIVYRAEHGAAWPFDLLCALYGGQVQTSRTYGTYPASPGVSRHSYRDAATEKRVTSQSWFEYSGITEQMPLKRRPLDRCRPPTGSV
jgi:hypothetical protein